MLLCFKVKPATSLFRRQITRTMSYNSHNDLNIWHATTRKVSAYSSDSTEICFQSLSERLMMRTHELFNFVAISFFISFHCILRLQHFLIDCTAKHRWLTAGPPPSHYEVLSAANKTTTKESKVQWSLIGIQIRGFPQQWSFREAYLIITAVQRKITSNDRHQISDQTVCFDNHWIAWMVSIAKSFANSPSISNQV